MLDGEDFDEAMWEDSDWSEEVNVRLSSYADSVHAKRVANWNARVIQLTDVMDKHGSNPVDAAFDTNLLKVSGAIITMPNI